MPPEIESTGPQKGWTLQEALERTANPPLWDALSAARTEWQQIKEKVGKVWVTERHPAEIQASKKYEAASDEVKSFFRSLLVNGSLASVGSREERSVPPSVIYREGWQSLRILDFPNSVVRERTGRTIKIYNVRIFPLIHGPDVGQELAGGSLADAFRKCVLQDPELIAAVKRLPDRERYDPILEGRFPQITVSFSWPLDWNAERLAFQLVSSSFVDLTSDPSPAIIQVARIMTDRMHALRRRLMNGEMIARARLAMGGVIQHVEPLEWSRPACWIDARGGDILEEEDNRLVLRWMSPALLHPASLNLLRPVPPHIYRPQDMSSTFPVKPPVSDTVRPLTTEPQRPPVKKSIMSAEARRNAKDQCAAWLQDLMEENRDERTESKPNLLKKARAKWPGISERAFDGAWERAVEGAKAPTWSAPGAPRKKGRGTIK